MGQIEVEVVGEVSKRCYLLLRIVAGQFEKEADALVVWVDMTDLDEGLCELLG